MALRKPPRDEPLVQLNRWQLTGALLGLGLIVVVVFFIGVVVGRQSTTVLPPELAEITSLVAADKPAQDKRRLYDVAVGTRGIDDELARPVLAVVPKDPTERARVGTHQQIRAGRANTVTDTPPAAGEGLAAPAPVAPEPQVGAGGAHFSLQLSAFETQGPAEMIAGDLQAAGHPAVARQVTGGGRTYWRVEVGRFATAEEAALFQRRFDQRTGASTVLVNTP